MINKINQHKRKDSSKFKVQKYSSSFRSHHVLTIDLSSPVNIRMSVCTTYCIFSPFIVSAANKKSTGYFSLSTCTFSVYWRAHFCIWSLFDC